MFDVHPISESNAQAGRSNHCIDTSSSEIFLRGNFGNIDGNHRSQEAVPNALANGESLSTRNAEESKHTMHTLPATRNDH
jgi:hypothetical protein